MPDEMLDTSLTKAVADSGALELAHDAIEQSLDSFLEEGPLKEIPIIKYALAAYRAPGQIRDLLLAKKITRFLGSLSDVPEDERREFVEKLDEKPGFHREVGEHLLLTIDRLDNMGKPELLAGVFRAYISGEITWQQFQDVSVVIDRCVVPDLTHVRAATAPTKFPPPVATRLSGCGVIEIDSIPMARGPGAANEYLLTELGNLIVKLQLSEAAGRVVASHLGDVAPSEAVGRS